MTTGAASVGRHGRRRGPGHLLAALMLSGVVLVAGCAQPKLPPPGAEAPVVVPRASLPHQQTPASAQGQAAAFVSVIRAMEPAVERECIERRRAPINCDFQFVVDDRPGLDPNAPPLPVGSTVVEIPGLPPITVPVLGPPPPPPPPP